MPYSSPFILSVQSSANYINSLVSRQFFMSFTQIGNERREGRRKVKGIQWGCEKRVV